MWAREVRKGFLKEVCTVPGFEGFHGEKTELEAGKQSGVCRSMTESTSGADGRFWELRSNSAQSGQGGLSADSEERHWRGTRTVPKGPGDIPLRSRPSLRQAVCM